MAERDAVTEHERALDGARREFMQRLGDTEAGPRRSASATGSLELTNTVGGTRCPQAIEDLSLQGLRNVDTSIRIPGTIGRVSGGCASPGAIGVPAGGGPRRSNRLQGKPPMSYSKAPSRPAYPGLTEVLPACAEDLCSSRVWSSPGLGGAPSRQAFYSPEGDPKVLAEPRSGIQRAIHGTARREVVLDSLPVRPLGGATDLIRSSRSGGSQLGCPRESRTL